MPKKLEQGWHSTEELAPFVRQRAYEVIVGNFMPASIEIKGVLTRGGTLSGDTIYLHPVISQDIEDIYART